jgi:uncharacterized protein with von Willebrand factor type A (vWA) domain
LFDRLAENLLDSGGLALRPLRLDPERDPEPENALRLLLEAGYLETRAGDNGTSVRVGPRGLARCEEMALLELLGPLKATRGGEVPAPAASPIPEAGAVPGESSRPHIPGEPLDHVDLHATLRNALARSGPRLPLPIHGDDLEVRPPEPLGQRSTVVLLDMSGSMSEYGKFGAARRTALALLTLIRRRFPADRLRVAGFATRVRPLAGPALLEAVPVPVGLVENRASARIRATITFAAGSAEPVPEHFTNIQAALRWGCDVLRKETNCARQLVLITDGEPTAHLEGNELVLAYPPTTAAVENTLREARRCAAEGIALSVHALLTDTSPGLGNFVADLARAARGTAVYCPPGQLGRRVLLRFLHSRFQPR